MTIHEGKGQRNSDNSAFKMLNEMLKYSRMNTFYIG